MFDIIKQQLSFNSFIPLNHEKYTQQGNWEHYLNIFKRLADDYFSCS